MKKVLNAIEEDVDSLLSQLKNEGQAVGYLLNPDEEMTRELLKGLIANEKRYGYRACPCRLAAGDKVQDLDIVCPCYYRDADLAEYHACYCALYVSEEVAGGIRKVKPIPERRNRSGELGTIPIWRCQVCGYLCGRETPPALCPICKVKKERFSKLGIHLKEA